MKDDYDQRYFPLRDIGAAQLAGWEIVRTPDGVIHENTPIPVRRKRQPMDKPLWGSDAN
jgi:hypothetical protein